MSMQLRLTALVGAIGTDVKTLTVNTGVLSGLTTTAKTNLVSAINEVNALLGALPSSITTQLNTLRDQILGGAGAAFDTLKELQDALADEDTVVNSLLAAMANRVRYDAPQTLTTAQQAQACVNIGVGDPEIDLVAIYTAAKV